MRQHPPLAFWSLSTTEMPRQLQTAKEGLTGGEAGERLAPYGSNLLKPSKRSDVFTLLLAQFKNPLILILFFARVCHSSYMSLSMFLLFFQLCSSAAPLGFGRSAVQATPWKSCFPSRESKLPCFVMEPSRRFRPKRLSPETSSS